MRRFEKTLRIHYLYIRDNESFYFYKMGCNCKSRKILDNAEKYSDNGKINYSLTLMQKILTTITQIGFGIVVGIVFMVMVIPFFIYVTFCVAFGKQATFNVDKFKKLLGGGRNE